MNSPRRAVLAAAAMRAGLIDEYAIVTHPVLMGGGKPFFTALDNRVNLGPGGDPAVTRRRAPDQVRDLALNPDPGSVAEDAACARRDAPCSQPRKRRVPL